MSIEEPTELAELLARAFDAPPPDPASWADEAAALATREDPEAEHYWSATRAAEDANRQAAAAAVRVQLALDEAERERIAAGDLTPEELAQLRLIQSIGIMDRLGAHLLADVSTDPPAPLLLGRLDPEGHSILYGTGGVGKGTMAAAWIVQLVAAGHRVLVLDYEGHPGEWARRISGLAGVAPLGEVVHVAPMAAAWQGRRGALWRQAADVRELAESWGATYVVVDSIVVACGGSDPLEPGTPAQYTGALEYIGRPVLSLAHVTKDHQLAYPFGSVFWHNLARVTWSMETDGTGILLVNRKANNYERPGRIRVDVTWMDGRPREVAERAYSAVIGDRVADMLAAGPLTVAEIVARLEDERGEGEKSTKPDSIRAVLRRGLKTVPRRFEMTGTGTAAKWSAVPE